MTQRSLNHARTTYPPQTRAITEPKHIPELPASDKQPGFLAAAAATANKGTTTAGAGKKKKPDPPQTAPTAAATAGGAPTAPVSGQKAVPAVQQPASTVLKPSSRPATPVPQLSARGRTLTRSSTSTASNATPAHVPGPAGKGSIRQSSPGPNRPAPSTPKKTSVLGRPQTPPPAQPRSKSPGGTLASQRYGPAAYRQSPKRGSTPVRQTTLQAAPAASTGEPAAVIDYLPSSVTPRRSPSPGKGNKMMPPESAAGSTTPGPRDRVAHNETPTRPERVTRIPTPNRTRPAPVEIASGADIPVYAGLTTPTRSTASTVVAPSTSVVHAGTAPHPNAGDASRGAETGDNRGAEPKGPA
jgi:hypothetical protein